MSSPSSEENQRAVRSVRFAEPAAGSNKRQRADGLDDEVERKRKRVDVDVARARARDEDDDDVAMVDDGDDQDPGEDGEEDVVPSVQELMEAKRRRREQRGAIGDTSTKGLESTSIDATTSLAAEGVEIEPFHMRQENSDGTGYFDGDTYVFRKDGDEEPDAWLDSLDENKGTGKSLSNSESEKDGTNRIMNNPSASIASSKRNEELKPAMDDWSREELFSVIVPLVSDTESVMKAIQRYGILIKKASKPKNKNKNKSISSDDDQDDNAQQRRDLAKSSLDDLTGAASALLLKGDVDIYQMTRNDILEKFPQQSNVKDAGSGQEGPGRKAPTQWEYRGNQDGQLHGPYSTKEMLAWTQAGYFVGTQQVQIRTVREEPQEPGAQATTNEDLLADLMDDDDDDDGDDEIVGNKDDKPAEPKIVKGEWLWSNNVDFKSYT